MSDKNEEKSPDQLADAVSSPSDVVEHVKLADITPSPENDLVYHPIRGNDPQLLDLANDIKESGKIREPLVVTKDGYIVSGHRRFAAAQHLKLDEIPIRRLARNRTEFSDDEFLKLLVAYNTQREKTPSERIREKNVRATPKPHHQIIAERLVLQNQETCGETIGAVGVIPRHKFSAALRPFVDVVKKLVMDLKPHWGISVRSVHYQLVSMNPCPIYNVKSGLRYDNTLNMSRKLSDVLTRMRVFGEIPFYAIIDETRSERTWNTQEGIDQHLDRQRRNLAASYHRDLMLGQSAYIEIVVEKLTIKQHVDRVAMQYTIPTVVARGKCSMPPRHNIWRRWRISGKEKLIIIVLADHDPDGRVISDMWQKSFVGDLRVPPRQLQVVRAGLNTDDIQRLQLPTSLDAKPTSPTYKEFVKKFGTDVYEIDAVPVDDLQAILKRTIESVVDREAYEKQVALEEKEAGLLEMVADDLGIYFADRLEGFE